MAVRLAVTEGAHRGQDFTFTEHDLFLVGRSRSAHCRLPDVDSSPFQFLLEVNPPSCRITDLGSHQGTYVNGKKAEVVDLKNGDLIQTGTTVLRLTVEAPGKMPATDRHRALSLSTDPCSPGLAQVRRPRAWPVGDRCLSCGGSLRTHPPIRCARAAATGATMKSSRSAATVSLKIWGGGVWVLFRWPCAFKTTGRWP